MSIQSISFIGSGNVATHLAIAVKAAGFEVREVYSLHKTHADMLARKVDARPIDLLRQLDNTTDLYIVAVPDKAVEIVAHALPPAEGVVVHTSGIVSLEVLHHLPRYGVFYPLQSFSKNRLPVMSQVPFCLEAGSEDVLNDLKEVASKLSGAVYEISTEKRKYLHLAAVLVNNYTNYLYRMAFDILKQQHIKSDLLIPLIEETYAKIKEMSPRLAQTGPARRKDLPTIEKHLSLLEEFPQYKELYSIFAEQIIKKYHE